MADIRERLVREPAPEGIRILEIGLDTGGTTAVVLPKLQPYQVHIREYCYTDISRAFLLHAQREYAPAHPFVPLKLFPLVEQSAAAQGIEVGGYDLVIATNVLHATKNIRRTLANAKATLRQGGLLLLNELNRNALFVHLAPVSSSSGGAPRIPDDVFWRSSWSDAPDIWARARRAKKVSITSPSRPGAEPTKEARTPRRQKRRTTQQTQDTSQSPAGAMRPDSLRSMKSPTFSPLSHREQG